MRTDNFTDVARGRPIARSRGVVRGVAVRRRKTGIETRACLPLSLRASGWSYALRKAYDAILSSYLDT